MSNDTATTADSRRSVDTAGRGEPAVRRIARSVYKLWIPRLILGGLFLLAWEYAVQTGLLDEFDVSKPSAVFVFLRDNVGSGELWHNTWVTLRETLIGTFIGGVAGVVTGAILGRLRYVSDLVEPFIVVLNSLPRIALAPLFILWFGIGEPSKVALVISLVFFIMLINTRSGMRSIDPDIEMMAKLMVLTGPQRLVKISLPSAVPAIFGGIKLSIAYGLLAAVSGELIAAQAGLGQQLTYLASVFEVAGVMGILAVLACIAVILSWFAGRLEAWLLKWQD
jgi:NitT/TauT family transport system permease protein